MKTLRIEFEQGCKQSKVLSDYLEKKILEHIYEGHRTFRCVARCLVENGQHKIKLTLKLPKKRMVILSSSSSNMYKSVDLLVPKLVNRMNHVWQYQKHNRCGIRQLSWNIEREAA